MKRYSNILLVLCLVGAALYGVGRLYYRVTGGFMESNITSDLAYDPRWEIRDQAPNEKSIVDKELDQPYTYLGKGCQSYVFVAKDGNYVIKFFKYQRFRPQYWLEYFSFIPPVERYRLYKVEKKKKKLESVFTSWKIAYEDLKDETGVIYVHLNKGDSLRKNLVLYDKIGMHHEVPLDQMEFLIQRKADLLCPTIDEMMAKGDVAGVKLLINRLLDMILSEYKRGIADNDHALMQNTGVIDGRPIHVDVGQFVKNGKVKDPIVFNQEIFNKTYKFRNWLKEKHPEIETFLTERLQEIIGPSFKDLKPTLRVGSVGVLSNEA